MRLNYFVYKNPNTLEYKVIDLSIPYKCDLSHCLKDIPQKIEIDKITLRIYFSILKNVARHYLMSIQT